jgi:hypothetical protein
MVGVFKINFFFDFLFKKLMENYRQPLDGLVVQGGRAHHHLEALARGRIVAGDSGVQLQDEAGRVVLAGQQRVRLVENLSQKEY